MEEELRKCIICELFKSIKYFQGLKKHKHKCSQCLNKEASDRRKYKKQKAIIYLGGSCRLCNYNKCNDVLQFHHVNPNEKEADWDVMCDWGWNRIEGELNKCVLLCANCHITVHYELRQGNDILKNNGIYPRSSAGSEQRISNPQVASSSLAVGAILLV